MDKWKRLLLLALPFNILLMWFIWQLNSDQYPWLVVLQLLIPILVWELLLASTFLPDFLELDPASDFETAPMSWIDSFVGRSIRSSGDFSISALD